MSGKDDSPIAVGKIRLDVPKLAELKTFVRSPVVSIANMPWYLEVYSECSQRTKDIKQLTVFAHCNDADQSPHWSCEAKVIFNLLSQKLGKKLHSRKSPVHTFCAKKNNWGYSSFIAWDEAVDPENGFIREKDDGAVLEATITVVKVIGLPMSPLNDFARLQPEHLTNVTLIVEEKELRVNKHYLAMYSPVFNAMFFTDFVERDEKVVPLPDVKHDEFVLFLNVFHPARMPVKAGTVEFLLRLADRFNVRVVLCECENFLCGAESGEVPLENKLLLAERFRLGRLMSICLNALKSVDDVNVLKAKQEFCDLSDKTKAALGERILELTMNSPLPS